MWSEIRSCSGWCFYIGFEDLIRQICKFWLCRLDVPLERGTSLVFLMATAIMLLGNMFCFWLHKCLRLIHKSLSSPCSASHQWWRALLLLLWIHVFWGRWLRHQCVKMAFAAQAQQFVHALKADFFQMGSLRDWSSKMNFSIYYMVVS